MLVDVLSVLRMEAVLFTRAEELALTRFGRQLF